MGSVTDIATRRPDQQVFMCDLKLYKDTDEKCEAQGHVLKKDGTVICSGCLLKSTFVWEMDSPPTDNKKRSLLRIKKSITLGGEMIFVCGYCGGVHFHFWENKTVHCMRCKKKANATFFID